MSSRCTTCSELLCLCCFIIPSPHHTKSFCLLQLIDWLPMPFLRGRPNSETIVNGMRAFFYLRCQNIQSNTPRLLSASLGVSHHEKF
mmetsp:Transcript_13411/g.25613  ORF Transcript_13411/g.25613 Transcript_13411/m.25613 type:complete len:87 (+) Transcript_13411:2147-2407(+)